jgi:hypothetical protein
MFVTVWTRGAVQDEYGKKDKEKHRLENTDILCYGSRAGNAGLYGL